MKLNREPVAILSAAGSIVAALTALGILSATIGGGLGTVIVALGGLFVRAKVTPVSSVEPLVAGAVVEAVADLEPGTAGPVGTVTPEGTRTATQAVSGALRTTETRAGELVSAVLRG